VPGYKLTIRNGPKVDREKHPSLDDAVASMRAHAERIRAAGGLPEVTMFRTYEPGARVEARLEISTGGPIRGRDAGVDVMGDGGLVPFRGGVFRKPIQPKEGESPFDAVAAVLAP
jgi:hypothetical protein